jgi:hypothetical protein
MKIDYWLLETQEDIDNFKLTFDIASPTEMARAIKRVRELLNSWEDFEPEPAHGVELRKALYGDDE